ncbi:uncharacterized protein LOC105356863 [Oryzias latipes]|uniref:uncharacterized protein LOC105356863 n=1 Tax=Oryzias latipes TaxID=8090 RepID=UPI0005CC434A|nr:uncharacterized protein LOC105356863 [Oryzias latipes]
MVPFILRVVFIAHMSHGFVVIQSLLYNVYPNQSAIIGCEHTGQSGNVEDFRLYSISGNNKKLLCQKGSSNCANVFYQASLNKTVFLLVNIGEEAMQLSYQCEFTLSHGGLFYTATGKPSKLQVIHVDEAGKSYTLLPKTQTAAPPPNEQISVLMWILIGLLLSTLLYSSFVTCCYIRLMRSKQDIENPTYVEMRKGPPSLNNIYDNLRLGAATVL